MFEAFYEFKATPFTRGIPTDQLFITKELEEVLSRMKYVSKQQLFAVLTGDCGTGKTTILRKLRDTLNPQRYRMLYVSESKLTPSNFYMIVLEQLGVHAGHSSAIAKQQLHEQLAVLKAVHDVSVVCVVDESHLLSFAMLEEIRFLLNTEFDSVSPLALILAGQPELWKRRLALEKCRAIRQRIDIQSELDHYNRAYTGQYVQCQLTYAGATSELFTEKAIDRIYEYSSGIARMIDKVCTSVLIYGSQNRMRLIDDHAVAKVLEGEFS